jgi:hypothetical protein
VKKPSIEHDAELLMAEEKQSPAKPTIWLLNDDYFDFKLVNNFPEYNCWRWH